MTEIVLMVSDRSLFFRVRSTNAGGVIEQEVAPSSGLVQSATASWIRPAVAVAAIGWGANQFAPMIVLYQRHGVSASATEAMFGLYAVGLVPALLVGGRWSDRVGRKAVVATALVLSMLASMMLLVGSVWHGLLCPGRFLAGISSGLAFGTGAAWIRELSAGHAHPHAGPRRATIAMTVGFGGGPLIAGMLAQWAARPQVWPYVPHLILCAVALVVLARFDASPAGPPSQNIAPRPVTRGTDESLTRHLLLITAPFAPWVFGTAGIALAYLPATVADRAGSQQLTFAAVATALPALAGVLVQPLVSRATDRPAAGLLMPAMVAAVAGLIVATWAAAMSAVWAVLVAVIVLGAAYGLTQFAGLADIQYVARPAQLGAATSTYQALSYLGFALPYLLTISHSRGLSPAQGLSAVTALAVLATAWLTLTTRIGKPTQG
ncbi:MFS transporter [Nocardia sp. NPDC052112]|uniref:MFS transporter n=1 Tax=Nocardia sp. NPDC052112 TaxID=3155646 RepID=UPI0034263110